MSNKRMVSSDTWRDEFFYQQDWFGRLLWVGMITICADDQGRFINNPRLIGVTVFPMDDDVTTGQVATKIKEFADAGRILLYEINGKRLIQILNWWKHQSPSWAANSPLPAPDGWTDRVKVHVKGGKVMILNWDKQGGFSQLPKQLPKQLHSTLDRPINEYEDEIKDEMSMRGDEDEDESSGSAAVQREAAPETPVHSFPVLAGEKAWEDIKRITEPEAQGDKFRYRSKVDPCQVVGQTGDTLQIRAPDPRTCAWLNTVFETMAYQNKVAAVMGEGSRVEFVVGHD